MYHNPFVSSSPERDHARDHGAKTGKWLPASVKSTCTGLSGARHDETAEIIARR